MHSIALKYEKKKTYSIKICTFTDITIVNFDKRDNDWITYEFVKILI